MPECRNAGMPEQTPEFDLSNDCFILDRDQDEYLQLPQAQSTPTTQLYPQNGSPQP